MIVREAMTSEVETIGPEDTVQYAAARMREQDVGILPVTIEGRAVGVVTDRDIALRCCAEGKNPRSTPVREIMTAEVVGCPDTENLREATRLMEQRKVRRLLVTDETGSLAGILSVDDLATRLQDPSVFTRVLRDVGLGWPRHSVRQR